MNKTSDEIVTEMIKEGKESFNDMFLLVDKDVNNFKTLIAEAIKTNSNILSENNLEAEQVIECFYNRINEIIGE